MRTLLILVPLAVVASGCCVLAGRCCGPASCSEAKTGFEVMQPVVAALDAYQRNEGTYPERLGDLVPEYLPSVPSKYEELPVGYERTPEGYTLRFSYSGAGIGMNHCSYTPEGLWDCYGYY